MAAACAASFGQHHRPSREHFAGDAAYVDRDMLPCADACCVSSDFTGMEFAPMPSFQHQQRFPRE
eukprot:scaffold224267_cov44-Prasinocladus_malaysianus.AAC.2